MRILFVSPVGQVGGAERVLLDCIASIRAVEKEHELLALLMEDGPLADELRKRSVQVSVLPVPSAIAVLGDSSIRDGRGEKRARWLLRALRVVPAMRRYVRRLRRAVRNIAPDVIHSNGLKSHLLLGRAKMRRPMAWHIHDFVGDRPMIARLLRTASRGVKTIAVSEAIAEDIRRWLPGASPVIVPNGIDLDHFSPGDAEGAKLDELSAMAPAPPGTVRIGMVATYARWKGQDVLLRAAAKVKRRETDAAIRFYIVGGPIYTTRGSQFSRDELEKLAIEIGVSDVVGFVPFQIDPVAIYRSLDVVVHASARPEPFGLCIVEAMACGRAVIVSAAGGARELFEDGIDALGIDPADADTLAEAMLRLSRDPQLRVNLGKSARITAQARFDRARLGPALLQIYRDLTGDK